MPTTKAQLKASIKSAYDAESDTPIDGETINDARERIAGKIADAVEAYIANRTVQVTGVQPGFGSAVGTIQI